MRGIVVVKFDLRDHAAPAIQGYGRGKSADIPIIWHVCRVDLSVWSCRIAGRRARVPSPLLDRWDVAMRVQPAVIDKFAWASYTRSPWNRRGELCCQGDD